jgi:fructokinase
VAASIGEWRVGVHEGPLFGGIEAGGTKFVCAVGTGPEHLHARTVIPTTTPDETIGRAVAFFRAQAPALAAVGIASFGPLDPDPRSPRFGHITTTPKPGWAHTDLAGAVGRSLGVPVGFDTDVNGAALAEHRWGAARELETFVYLTIGTGIGGGGMVNGQLLHGLMHPEMGHIPIPHDRAADPYAGACPYHGDCLEGLASGPAMEQRWGMKAESLPPEHPAWALEAHYLSLGLVNIICTLAPQRVILGGGVMQQAHLFPLIRERVRALLNGYLPHLDDAAALERSIVPPALGDRAGVLGAIALGRRIVRHAAR